MFSLEHVDLLRNLPPEEIDGSSVPRFQDFLNNVAFEEEKKDGHRDANQMRSDVAKGIGFERYLMSTGLFVESAPVVADARKSIKFSDRMKDLLYDGQAIQVKTVTKIYGNYVYINPAMYKSIMRCVDFNDFFVFGLSEIKGSRDEGCTVFLHRPAFSIESKVLKRSIGTTGEIYINLDRMSRYPDYFQSLTQELDDV